MPMAVPATVPPSRLCTKFVPPIVFAQEVWGTISMFVFVILMCEALPRPFQKNIHNLLCAGTLPANMVQKNIERYGGTLPISFGIL